MSNSISSLVLIFYDTGGTEDEDDDNSKDDTKSHGRSRKDSIFSQRRLDKDESGAKQMKKAKVHVEVRRFSFGFIAGIIIYSYIRDLYFDKSMLFDSLG